MITDDSEIPKSTLVTVLHLGHKVPDAMTHYSLTLKDPILNATSKYQRNT